MGGSSPAGVGELGVLGVGAVVAVLGIGVGAFDVGDGVVVAVAVLVVAVGGAVVAAGPVMRFKMRLRSAKYHAFTCGSIVAMSAPIRNTRSMFLFFEAMLVLRRSSLMSCFVINVDHLASDFSSLMAV
ncbi:Ribosomal RNA small subunit methyltransferase E [Hordeum vulgare]|nr:Ribosomal RNA small subunit methyltransferase E [Hordeum vulgare]